MTDTQVGREAAERSELESARRADRDAFEHLYEQHAPAAWRLALVVTRDRAVAEGAVVDAFARVLARPERHDVHRFARQPDGLYGYRQQCVYGQGDR